MTLCWSHNNSKHSIILRASLPSSCHICHFHDDQRELFHWCSVLTRHQATINIYISTFNSHALTCSRLQKTQHRYLTEICKKTQTLPHPLNSPTLYDTTQWPGCRLVHTPLDTQTPCHDTYLG